MAFSRLEPSQTGGPRAIHRQPPVRAPTLARGLADELLAEVKHHLRHVAGELGHAWVPERAGVSRRASSHGGGSAPVPGACSKT